MIPDEKPHLVLDSRSIDGDCRRRSSGWASAESSGRDDKRIKLNKKKYSNRPGQSSLVLLIVARSGNCNFYRWCFCSEISASSSDSPSPIPNLTRTRTSWNSIPNCCCCCFRRGDDDDGDVALSFPSPNLLFLFPPCSFLHRLPPPAQARSSYLPRRESRSGWAPPFLLCSQVSVLKRWKNRHWAITEFDISKMCRGNL